VSSKFLCQLEYDTWLIICRVAVAVKDNGDSVTTYLFRSYIHPVIHGQTHALNPDNVGCDMDIVGVARATSAAPGYFKVFAVGNEHKFMDGGVKANNPSGFAWNEAVQMARVQENGITAGRAIACFLSIGTGNSKYEIFGRKGQNSFSKYMTMKKAPVKMLTDTVGITFTGIVHPC